MGNNRKGNYKRKVRSSSGAVEVAVPRDRPGDFEPKLLPTYETSCNALADNSIRLDAKGLSVRAMHDSVAERYAVEVSAGPISPLPEKVWPLVEAWQSRPLEQVYALIQLEASPVHRRRAGRMERTASQLVLAVDRHGGKEVLGHWGGEGAAGAKLWTTGLGQLPARGVTDILSACVEGLTGCKEASHAVCPKMPIQRCIVQPSRNSLTAVSSTDQDEFVRALKTIDQAPTRAAAETALLKVADTGNNQDALAVRAWENNGPELSTCFDCPDEIRRLIDTTHALAGYHRQRRQVTQNNSVLPTEDALRKAFYLAPPDMALKGTRPIGPQA